MQLNQPVTVSFPDQGLTVKGKLAFLNPELSDESKVDLVCITIPNTDGQLRPGMQAYISTGNGGRSLAVPASAVLTDGKGSHVWVKNIDGSYSPRMIQIGKGNQAFIQIISGLTFGEIVVTSGAYLLNSESIFKNGQAMAGMRM